MSDRHLRFRKEVGQRQAEKAKAKREEAAVIREVRAQVEQRDGYCRLVRQQVLFGPCGVLSQWAHHGEQKRYRTRNLPPRERHTTHGTLMLCNYHHAAYDSGRMQIVALTERGTDGPLAFGMGGRQWEEV